MPLLTQFETPAFLRDAPAGSAFYKNWSDYIRGEIRATTIGDNSGAFYDPTETDVSVIAEKEIVWMGFPRDLFLPGRRDNKYEAYQDAESTLATRRKQNEYFEWYVHKNARDKITRITFVTEFRQYFRELWNVDRNAVVRIYRNLVSPLVQEADLHSGGVYDIFNVWNTTKGIVHFIQGINTLADAVGLSESSVSATIPGRDNFEAFPRYAHNITSVDPRASYDVNMLVRKGLYVSFKDPIGIYIRDWDNSGITKPDGRPAPSSYWKIKRGRPGMVLRLEYEVPPGAGFVVGDLKIGGRPIKYGGQLAEHITVSITGTAGNKNTP